MKEPLYIYLKTHFGEIVNQERFRYQRRKNDIIEKWKRMYGKKFDDLVVEEQAPKPKEIRVPKKKNIPKYGKVINNPHISKRDGDGWGSI